MANEIRAAIARQGVEVLEYPKHDQATHVLFITHPSRPPGWYKNQSVTLFSMWETTQLPFEHLTSVPLYDKILVPCQTNKELFEQVNPNVSVVPLGCDYDLWSITPHVMSHPFTVITGGAGSLRKGFDASFRVFTKFSDWVEKMGHPSPRLIIKGTANLSSPRDNITVVTERLSAEDEKALYDTAHVYLGLSRGEGWGMIPHQTIASGKPTILTDAAGHAEFSQYGIPIPWHPMESVNEIVGRSGDWWSPDEDVALDALKEVFLDYPLFAERAANSAEGIHEFTWDRTATEILNNLPDQKGEIGEWVDCPQTLLAMFVVKPCEANIGGQAFRFQPGVQYNVTADVKRVMYDAGFVDPACLDPFEKAILSNPTPKNIDEGFAA